MANLNSLGFAQVILMKSLDPQKNKEEAIEAKPKCNSSGISLMNAGSSISVLEDLSSHGGSTLPMAILFGKDWTVA